MLVWSGSGHVRYSGSRVSLRWVVRAREDGRLTFRVWARQGALHSGSKGRRGGVAWRG